MLFEGMGSFAFLLVFSLFMVFHPFLLKFKIDAWLRRGKRPKSLGILRFRGAQVRKKAYPRRKGLSESALRILANGLKIPENRRKSPPHGVAGRCRTPR
jgi:hypothetical protein